MSNGCDLLLKGFYSEYLEKYQEIWKTETTNNVNQKMKVMKDNNDLSFYIVHYWFHYASSSCSPNYISYLLADLYTINSFGVY